MTDEIQAGDWRYHLAYGEVFEAIGLSGENRWYVRYPDGHVVSTWTLRELLAHTRPATRKEIFKAKIEALSEGQKARVSWYDDGCLLAVDGVSVGVYAPNTWHTPAREPFERVGLKDLITRFDKALQVQDNTDEDTSHKTYHQLLNKLCDAFSVPGSPDFDGALKFVSDKLHLREQQLRGSQDYWVNLITERDRYMSRCKDLEHQLALVRDAANRETKGIRG